MAQTLAIIGFAVLGIIAGLFAGISICLTGAKFSLLLWNGEGTWLGGMWWANASWWIVPTTIAVLGIGGAIIGARVRP